MKIVVSHAYEQKRLKLMASLTEGQDVLDLGYAQHPNPYFEGARVVGVDLQKPKSPSSYAEELIGDVNELASVVGERRFDTVICGELIEHVENPYALLRSIREVLAPSGRLLLSTPNPMSFPVALAEAARSSRFFYTREHLYYFLPRWVKRLVEATDYELEDMRAVGLWTPWAALPSPVALSYQVIYVARPR